MNRRHQLDPNRIPEHVAIIMDGNGRWAAGRGLPRHRGHREGLTAAKRTVKGAREIGVRVLSLFTFSTENWKRAEEEVSFLMNLITSHLRREYDFYRDNSVRVLHSGDIDGLPANLQTEIASVTADTADHDGILVNLAINYGGRDEIVRSIERLARRDVTDSRIDAETLRAHLDLPDLPDPDLVIRTGGEYRLSNFLLWQCAYSELYFTDVLWPDFGIDDLIDAIVDYQRRERRFGAVPCAT